MSIGYTYFLKNVDIYIYRYDFNWLNCYIYNKLTIYYYLKLCMYHFQLTELSDN